MGWTIFTRSNQCYNMLEVVNRMVNHGIDPAHGEAKVSDPWLVWPRVGWCHDYAITKREELLLRGYKANKLLLCEVELADGQHHMVLIVDDQVLDNLIQHVYPLSAMHYKIVRIQSKDNPDFWETPES